MPFWREKATIFEGYALGIGAVVVVIAWATL
jgi:hypothetical protein